VLECPEAPLSRRGQLLSAPAPPWRGISIPRKARHQRAPSLRSALALTHSLEAEPRQSLVSSPILFSRLQRARPSRRAPNAPTEQRAINRCARRSTRAGRCAQCVGWLGAGAGALRLRGSSRAASRRRAVPPTAVSSHALHAFGGTLNWVHEYCEPPAGAAALLARFLLPCVGRRRPTPFHPCIPSRPPAMQQALLRGLDGYRGKKR